MRDQVWATIARHVPVEVQDQLALVTTTGTEIAMQGILRIEHEFMIIKGRLSGSQEGGRIFFVAFSQIDYLGTQKPMKEAEFQELFGTLAVPGRTSEVAPAEAPEAPEAPAQAPSAPSARPASFGALPAVDSGPRPVIKSAVLERFRARNSVSDTPAPSAGDS